MRHGLHKRKCLKTAALILAAVLSLLAQPVFPGLARKVSAWADKGPARAQAGVSNDVNQASPGPAVQTASEKFFSLNPNRISVLYFFLLLGAAVLSSLSAARFNRNIFIRKLKAVNDIEEAIGRAAEMGRPALYLTGLYDMNALPTMASIELLSYVSEKTAVYDTRLIVPCCRSLVMNAARETVRSSLIKTGREGSYDPENIKYITDDQWGFASAVTGIMKREKPAVCFYFGQFVSESLVYAETGHGVGAVQIAGTNEFSQIPFFVAACDSCLIGEELYAASAYFSKKHSDAGTLRGLDICKILLIAVILTGAAFETIYAIAPDKFMALHKLKTVLLFEQ